MKAKEKQLLEYLKKHCLGQENAVSGKRLKKILRVHEAELRKLVHNLRVDGAPIFMKAKEKQLLEYLKKHCPGRENAISGKQMKKRFRIHEAELRKLVHNLRVDGAPICSDRTGYFYPANAWEVIATIGHLRRMRDGVEKAIRSLERATGAFRLPGGGEADR